MALHDVAPWSLHRVQEIRAWLRHRGVTRTTLLVIPAADGRPLGDGSETLTAWLHGRMTRGDVVAQHGLAHRAEARPPAPRRLLAGWQGREAAEFPGLSPAETVRRVSDGRRVLVEAGLEPGGFVAPAYAYTGSLRAILRETFSWFADLRGVEVPNGASVRSPALCLGSSTALKRAVSPFLVRGLATRPAALMRLDVHPADFDHRRHVEALERVLERASGRESLTYDDLVG